MNTRRSFIEGFAIWNDVNEPDLCHFKAKVTSITVRHNEISFEFHGSDLVGNCKLIKKDDCRFTGTGQSGHCRNALVTGAVKVELRTTIDGDVILDGFWLDEGDDEPYKFNLDAMFQST
ncbi:MAG: hypothetical protein GW890_02955 [Vibrio sp.]|nr:hypothetical protein [Vibrio sp.]